MKLPRLPVMNSLGLLLLRAYGALLAFSPGWMKLSQFTTFAPDFPDPLHVGHTASFALTVFAEFVCGLLVAAGFLTRLACIPIIGLFAVIIFNVLADAPWDKQQIAVLYAIPFVVLFFTGPGRYSIDGLRGAPSAKK